jgi:sodium transport system permease protein
VSVVWAVMRKELLDLFRDRRTVMMGLFMGPLLFPALILGMGAMAESRARTQLESTLELPVIGAQNAPNLTAFLAAANIEVIAPPDDPQAAIRDQRHEVVLSIPDDYPELWRQSRPALVEIFYDSSRQDSRIPVARVEGALRAYSRQVATLRLMVRGVDPALGEAVVPGRRDLSTPEARRGMALAFLPYLLILSAFLGGVYLVIDVTAGERERQSLEPLLATPSSREAIMSGKIAAACAFGMLSLLLILLSFKLSFQLAGTGPFRGVDVSFAAMGKLLAILAPMVLIGTTLLTLISASVKSVKEAQSYMSILMLLPIIPTIVLMISPVKNQLWMFTVPFLGQNQAILMVLRAESIGAREWLAYLGAGFGLGFVLWLIAARLYHREKLAISA